MRWNKRFQLLMSLIAAATQAAHWVHGAPAVSTPAAFSFETVRQRAAALAAAEYHPEPDRLPEALKKLSYDDFQAIRYRPEMGPWQDQKLRFTLQFFHPGYLYRDGVIIHLLEDGEVNEFPFNANQFEYGTNRLPSPLPADIHFSGLRVLYPVNLPIKQDEVAAFVGASYFRLLGAGQRYGMSARALAVNTAEPSGEEFPRFTEFWIRRPAPGVTSLDLFALLDSPSLAGAFRFVLKPGRETVLDVEADVYIRKDIRKLGVAPLTSMFLVGANRTRYFADFRPEIHDSDGLLAQTTPGEWQWRPLLNPEKSHHLTYFTSDNLKGFGLLQRHRDFCNYEDLGARYELRPNFWVEPRASWGQGALELVEIPTSTEWNDNVVAYWIPKEKPAARQQFHFVYSLSASLGDPPRPALSSVRSTRIDPPRDKKPARFIIDFSNPRALGVAADAPVTAKVEISKGEIRNLVTQRNEVLGGWRVFFDITPPAGEHAELRAVLRLGERVISETWNYSFLP